MDSLSPFLLGLFIIITLSILFQLSGLCCTIWFYFQKPSPLNKKRSSFPGVTIIKPCHHHQDKEEENFDHFFNQDYEKEFRAPLELIFVVSTDKAPIIPIIQSYLSKYPRADAKLIISKTRNACWKKVDALYDGHQIAKHDYVIWSDSDTIVQKNYVSQIVSSLEEDGVSVVTTPQYDTHANNFASAFKTLGNNCDVATFLMRVDSAYTPEFRFF